jgi:hypothetical protein
MLYQGLVPLKIKLQYLPPLFIYPITCKFSVSQFEHSRNGPKSD